jgi:hypothetical protein
MKEVLETLARLWAPIANAPLWARLLVAAALFVGVAEAGQSGFLGSSLFWVAARVVPWPPLLEPLRTITTTYTIRSSSDGSWGPLAFGGPCPVGSQVDLSFQRSADGWVAVAGWNAREGLYPIATAGVQSLPVEKNNVYSFRLDMNSSAGREYLIILGSSKPFDAKRSFDDVAARLRASPADARGGVPELEGVALGHVAAGNLGSCVS